MKIYNLIVNIGEDEVFIMPYSTEHKAISAGEESEIIYEGDINYWAVSVAILDSSVNGNTVH